MAVMHSQQLSADLWEALWDLWALVTSCFTLDWQRSAAEQIPPLSMLHTLRTVLCWRSEPLENCWHKSQPNRIYNLLFALAFLWSSLILILWLWFTTTSVLGSGVEEVSQIQQLQQGLSNAQHHLRLEETSRQPQGPAIFVVVSSVRIRLRTWRQHKASVLSVLGAGTEALHAGIPLVLSPTSQLSMA